MGKYLDLDDVAAGNPVAEHELAQLREQYESLLETRQMEIRATEEWKDRAQRAEAECERLRNAFVEQRFQYYWKTRGMNVGQARIHAETDLNLIRTTPPPEGAYALTEEQLGGESGTAATALPSTKPNAFRGRRICRRGPFVGRKTESEHANGFASTTIRLMGFLNW